tara:strand:- start:224 stop:433 length:210 start_codon:yes stop_codon:yes gene_type:complete
MKRAAAKRKFITSQRSLNYNKLSVGCAPCLKEALKIDRQVNGRSLNEIKINEIKDIVRSIFKNSKNETS